MTLPVKPAAGELIEAIIAHDVARAETLILQGADLNEEDKTGMPALLCAVCEKLPQIVKLLIENGADMEARYGDLTGFTTLMYATHDVQILRLMIEKGAYLGTEDYHGNTALDWAERTDRKEAVKLLEEGEAIQKQIKDLREKTAASHEAASETQDHLRTRLPVSIRRRPAP